MTGYTPPRRNRAPCYGCPKLYRENDPHRVEYYCRAKSKRGRYIKGMRFMNDLRAAYATKVVDSRIKADMRPAWCPLEKKGEK